MDWALGSDVTHARGPGLSRNKYLLDAFTPAAKHPLPSYSDSTNALTGMIDNPEALGLIRTVIAHAFLFLQNQSQEPLPDEWTRFVSANRSRALSAKSFPLRYAAGWRWQNVTVDAPWTGRDAALTCLDLRLLPAGTDFCVVVAARGSGSSRRSAGLMPPAALAAAVVCRSRLPP